MSNEIKCPKCGEVFQVAESDYVEILQQIKNKEFQKELQKELDLKTSNYQYEIEKIKNKNVMDIQQLKNDAENRRKDDEIRYKQEIDNLRHQLQLCEKDQELKIQKATEGLNQSLMKKEVEIGSLKNEIDKAQQEYELWKTQEQQHHQKELKDKDDQIEYYKDLKTKLSTKMLGETLEKHCQIEFNKLRAMGFKNAYFEKDNDIKTGSKGDFIFRDYDDDGTEYISIMFEMKNESDTTSTKKKNEDFFKELDKDRNEKHCEYAVLVSLLEAEDELYNSGIVDVSYKYSKMYVVRPQFFLPIITLLRNAAMNSLKYRKELNTIRNQNIDISNFENEMNEFKEKFSKNVQIAGKKFKTAIEEIDKTIDHLQKTKDALVSSDRQLQLANQKADDLSIKRLTRNNPTMKEKFAALKTELD